MLLIDPIVLGARTVFAELLVWWKAAPRSRGGRIEPVNKWPEPKEAENAHDSDD